MYGVKHILLLVFSVVLFDSLVAQSIHGRIVDENNEGLINSSVLLKTWDDNQIINFGTSDDDGFFEIEIPTEYLDRNYALECRYIGYESIRVKVKDTDSLYRMQLIPSNYMLGEVQIQANATGVVISGDTTTIDPSVFTHGKESTLKDVLDKLPGIKIDENGNVNYQGRSVDKVKLDGDEFMNRQRGALLSTFAAHDIENIKLYEEEENNKQLLTLDIAVTEESTKSLNLDASIGLGVKDKLSGELSLYTLGRQLKIYSVSKINNTGQSVATLGDYLAMIDLGSMSSNTINVPSIFTKNHSNYQGWQAYSGLNISWRPDSTQQLRSTLYGIGASLLGYNSSNQSRSNQVFLENLATPENRFANIGSTTDYKKRLGRHWQVKGELDVNIGYGQDSIFVIQNIANQSDSYIQFNNDKNIGVNISGELNYSISNKMEVSYQLETYHTYTQKDLLAHDFNNRQYNVLNESFSADSINQSLKNNTFSQRHELRFNHTSKKGHSYYFTPYLQSIQNDYQWNNPLIAIDKSTKLSYRQLGLMLGTSFEFLGAYVNWNNRINKIHDLYDHSKWYWATHLQISYSLPSSPLFFYLNATNDFAPYVYGSHPSSFRFEDVNNVRIEIDQLNDLIHEKNLLFLATYPIPTIGLNLYTSFVYSNTNNSVAYDNQFLPNYSILVLNQQGNHLSKSINFGLEKKSYRLGLNVKYRLNVGNIDMVQYVDSEEQNAEYSKMQHAVRLNTTWKSFPTNFELLWLHTSNSTLNNFNTLNEHQLKMTTIYSPHNNSGLRAKAGFEYFNYSYGNINQWRWIFEVEHPITAHWYLGLKAYDFLRLNRRDRASFVEAGLIRSINIQRDFPGYILFTIRYRH